MNEKAVTGLLGLAQRAGQVVVGSERSLDHIRRKATGLMLIDRSASDNTLKRLQDACNHHQVAAATLPTDLLGNALGRPGTMAALMLPGGLMERMSGLLDENQQPQKNEIATKRRTRVE